MEKICICIKNIGVWHSFEKNETATMFFLKKPFLVVNTKMLSMILWNIPETKILEYKKIGVISMGKMIPSYTYTGIHNSI